jgi:phosphatidylserine/phosphatidylglycerophosphate/cardiolipin synthase-like enzyme
MPLSMVTREGLTFDDDTRRRPGARSDFGASGIEPLAAAGVPIWTDDRARLAHAKTMVVDGTVTLMGSYNWTRGAPENSEDLNFVSSPTVAAAYTTHWRQRLAISVRFDRREDCCRVSSAEAR